MRTVLTILVAGLMACAFVPFAAAQDSGMRFGMGVELMNQPTIVDVTGPGNLSLSGGTSSLTPAILFSLQATPAVFIEPFVGFHRMSDTNEPTGDPKETLSAYDLILGAGLIYVVNPDATVSPIVHPLFSVDLLKATDEVGGTKDEAKTTAFSVGLGVGGMIKAKEGFYFTAEGRLNFTHVGDFKVSGPGIVDTDKTSANLFDTDMVLGVRYVF